MQGRYNKKYRKIREDDRAEYLKKEYLREETKQ
jgi:hypothetical protein